MSDAATVDVDNDFEAPIPEQEDDKAAFVVDVDGFEGPIDVLLTLARDQKVDLVHISILQLADQYLAFVALARRSNLELAADYLVMAAWLAYLKSRLLLPAMAGVEEPSGEDMAAALTFQLQRLEAIQKAGAALLTRPRRGRDVFARGAPESFSDVTRPVWQATLYDLLRAYADHKKRQWGHGPLQIEAFDLYSVEDALQRLRRLLGPMPDWTNLWRFLPGDIGQGLTWRSAVAATFTASLEMCREGQLRLRQDATYGPILVRAGGPGGDGAKDGPGTAPPP